jgi:hypothetical protein
MVLGWSSLGGVINSPCQAVEVYRLGQEVKVLRSLKTFSGENVLPGFVSALDRIFSSVEQWVWSSRAAVALSCSTGANSTKVRGDRLPLQRKQ